MADRASDKSRVKVAASMKIKLIKSTEHWRYNATVERIIDKVEEETGYEADSYSEYDDFIDEFRVLVKRWLVDAGWDVEWAHQQTVGTGCIVQQGGQAEYHAFSAACDASSKEFSDDLRRYMEVERTQENEVKAGYVIDNHGNILVQIPDDNQWGFSLCDGESTQPGGFGFSAKEWTLLSDDDPRITDEVRESLQWILDGIEHHEDEQHGHIRADLER